MMSKISKLVLALSLYGIASGQLEELQTLAEALVKNKEALDKVTVGADWQSEVTTITLGKTGFEHADGSYDGLFFKAPEELEGKDFIWYFNAPEDWANWYIVPLDGDVKQAFRNWLIGDKVYQGFDKAGEKGRFRVLQTLDGSYFEPGKEYAIWFRKMGDAKPGEIRLRVGFAKPEEDGKWEYEELEKALGLEPQSSEAQVAELQSLGGAILLDKKLFDRGYADSRIDSLFFSKRQQQQMSGGFFIQIKSGSSGILMHGF